MKAHDVHDDDIPVGRLLSRKEMVALLAGASTVFLVGCGDATSTQPATATTPAASPTAQATATSQPTTAAAATATTQAKSAAATTTQASASTTQAATTAAASQTTTVATTAAASSASATLPTCVVVPALTEGPYFVDEKLNRSDIRSDPTDGTVKAGVPLKLTFNVSQMGSGCTAFAGAYVDIWQCDALGQYSDVVDNGVGFNTKGKKFLRGYQVTDANGQATFTTIYPGWYQGRTVHIHFKIRSALDSKTAYTFTSQLFFDDSLSDQIFTLSPYSSKGQQGRTKNASDGIYRQAGNLLLLKPTKEGDGYTATFNIGVQKA